MKINILYGSSCVGKSTLMVNIPNNNLIKVETDDCEYWRHPENQWENLSIEYLKKKIKENKENIDMIFTCGGLPLPTHQIYKDLSEKYNIYFLHILVVSKSIELYKKQIISRGRVNIMDQLINDHKCRESKKELYDKVLINLNIDTLNFIKNIN
jgi:hypothetical protein